MRVDELLSPPQRAVLDRLHRIDADERARGERTDRSAMALAPEVAALLLLLVIQRGARRIVELGTSLGYSTIHLAAGAARTGGTVETVDALAHKTEAARANLTEAGLIHRVTLVTSDAADWAPNVASTPGMDLVLVDCPVAEIERAVHPLVDRLSPHGVLFVDGGPPGYWDAAGAPLWSELEGRGDLVVSRLGMHKEHVLAVRLGAARGC